MRRKTKQRIFTPCDALFLFAWAIIPFLNLSCTTAKSVENNSLYRTDTVIVERTDTIKEVIREFIKDEQREKDSVSVSTRNDTVFVDRWHTKEITKWLMAKKNKQESSTQQKSQKSTEKQTEEKVKEIEKEDPITKLTEYINLALLVIIIMVQFYEHRKKK